MDAEEVDAWLDEDNRKQNPFVADMKENVNKTKARLLLRKLHTFTIIPEFLEDAIRCLLLPETEQKGVTVLFPEKSDILKFEIIEVFIKKNDFKTKREWVAQIRKEYNALAAENVLPESLMAAFKAALDNIEHELTLSNIREIKKILSDAE